MTETATAALVATAALLLYAAVAAPQERTRHALVLALSLTCGLALLVRLPSALVVVAAAVALALHGRGRYDVARIALWLAPGPLLAFVSLALYNKTNFGSIGVDPVSWTHSLWGDRSPRCDRSILRSSGSRS